MSAKLQIQIGQDDDENAIFAPAKYIVCTKCEGAGSHVNPAIDGNGITSDEWQNEWSEDEKETYLSGGYDVECHECKGQKVVLVLDESKATPEQKRIHEENEQDDAEYEQLCRMERLMGA